MITGEDHRVLVHQFDYQSQRVVQFSERRFRDGTPVPMGGALVRESSDSFCVVAQFLSVAADLTAINAIRALTHEPVKLFLGREAQVWPIILDELSSRENLGTLADRFRDHGQKRRQGNALWIKV